MGAGSSMPSPASPRRPATDPSCSLEDEASLLALPTFAFLNPLFAQGAEQTLELEDLGRCSAQDSSRPLFAAFSREYERESRRERGRRSLWRVLWRTVGLHRLLAALLLYMLSAAVAYGPIEIMNSLTRFFQGSIELSLAVQYVLVVLVLLLLVVNSLALAHRCDFDQLATLPLSYVCLSAT